MDGIEVTKRVSARLIERAASEITHGCQVPGEMTKTTFLLLQAREEEMETAAARGQDCTPGFDDERGEIEQLMAASPWTLHPDHGCVRRSDVARLDSAAGSAS